MNSPHLRPATSERSLRKLKKHKPLLMLKDPTESNTLHEINHDHVIGTRDIQERQRPLESVKRDTILIDLTNNDVLPALDYAFAILEAEQEASSPSANNSTFPPSSSSSSPSSSLHCSPTPSVLTSGSPPRYISAWKAHSPIPVSPRRSPPPAYHSRHPTVGTCPLDPQEFAHVFSQTRLSNSPHHVKSVPPSIPFPPSPPSPSTRVPLLQRKPRLSPPATDTVSFDMRDPFVFDNRSNITLVRSVSALDRRRDCAAYKSTTSVNTIESTWSTLLPRRPLLRSPSLKFFSSPRKLRLGTLNRSGSITASLKNPSSNIRVTSSSDLICDMDDPFRC